MSFADKARENLAVGKALVQGGHFDAAANRLYYAMFHAGVHSLEAQGKTPRSLEMNAESWGHKMVVSNASLVRQVRTDRRLFEAMKGLREDADYTPETVERERIDGRLVEVESLIADVLNGESNG